MRLPDNDTFLFMDIDQHVRELLKSMSEGVYEKEHILAMSLLSAVAGESIFLLGPPGTAKSLVARKLKMIFKDGSAFEYLMSRFSTPDEIFGPVSISLLKNEDKYERVVDGFLPTATVVFLDEIWKAGPSIQNALLTAINERIFQNGRTTLKLPMKALIAASNELPAEGEGLEALWDRFLVRMVSNCIQSESIFYKMIRQKNLKSNHVPDYLLISDELYDKWQQGIEEIEISNEICSIITNIRKRLKAEIKKDEVEEMDYYISDRRWKKCVHLLQSSAFLNGRKQIDLTDIPILIHCLWNKSETIPTIIDIVCSSITSPIDAKVVKYGKDIDQALNCIRKKPASSNSQEIDEDDYVQVNFFYYNILKYHTGKTLFYKMDYSHVPTKQTCDGILYYDETKQAHIIHAIYTGQLYDYKIKNTQEAKKVKLSKCYGGIVIDNIPYAFQTKRTNAQPTIFNQPGFPSPNITLKILNDIRNELLVKLSDQQKTFDYYRNLFLSDDDIKIVKQYLSQCEKSLKEMEVKAQNASLLL
jgi:MoxR-like ATPase